MKTSFNHLALAAIGSLALASTAFSQAVFFDGTGLDADYNVPTNWNTDVLPGPTNEVQFRNNRVNQYSVNITGTHTVDQVRVGFAGTIGNPAPILNFNSGTYTATNGILLGQSSSGGTINIAGASVSTGTAIFAVGNVDLLTGGSSTLNMSSGSLSTGSFRPFEGSTINYSGGAVTVSVFNPLAATNHTANPIFNYSNIGQAGQTFTINGNWATGTTDPIQVQLNLLSLDATWASTANVGDSVTLFTAGTGFNFTGNFAANPFSNISAGDTLTLGGIDFEFFANTVDGIGLTVIPEPSSAVLLLSGVVGLVALRRRRSARLA